MKYIIFPAFLLVISFSAFSQRVSKTILTDKIGTIECKYNTVKDKESDDSLSYTILLFQNAKYQTITDIKSIILPTLSDIKELSKIIAEIIKEVESSTKNDITYKKENYTIYKFDNSKSIALYTKENDAFTYFTIKQGLKLIDFLSKVELEMTK